MPPACTRNRWVLYGVPWLAALAAVVTALSLRPARAESLAVWILIGSILFFGLPHGAADWWVLRSLVSRRSASTLAFVLLVTGYVLAALATLGVWFWQPGWALVGFLALTAWHFGSADASVLLPDKTPWHDPVWWLFGVGRGLLVIFTPLTFWPVRSAGILMPFVALGSDTGAVVPGLLRVAPNFLWLGAVLQTAGLCLEIRTRFTGRDQRTVAFEGLETGVLLMLFRVAPPLLAFASYWIAFHAWRHLLRMEHTLHPVGPIPLWRAVVDFHWRTLPLTLLSLLGLGLIFLVWPTLLHGSAQVITAYLILLSALTVPHAVVMGWLDEEDAKSQR